MLRIKSQIYFTGAGGISCGRTLLLRCRSFVARNLFYDYIHLSKFNIFKGDSWNSL